jgi:hypothetical protein
MSANSGRAGIEIQKQQIAFDPKPSKGRAEIEIFQRRLDFPATGKLPRRPDYRRELSDFSPFERTPLHGRRQSASGLGQSRVRPRNRCLQVAVVLVKRCRAQCG